jgi:hypothetical protein
MFVCSDKSEQACVEIPELPQSTSANGNVWIPAEIQRDTSHAALTTAKHSERTAEVSELEKASVLEICSVARRLA